MSKKTLENLIKMPRAHLVVVEQGAQLQKAPRDDA